MFINAILIHIRVLCQMDRGIEELGSWQREMRKWVETGNGAHRNGNTLLKSKIGDRSVSEKVVTALLKYIQQICK